MPQDYARARELYERACEGGDMLGCHNLGWLYDNRRAVPQDDHEDLDERARDGGNLDGRFPMGESPRYLEAGTLIFLTFVPVLAPSHPSTSPLG